MKTILTYGTFDLFHIGHLRLLERLSKMGDKLIVGISTDEFNELKGKKSIISFEDRAQIVGAIKFVDEVIAERSWEQKIEDIKAHNVSVFAIGDDWAGQFDHLKAHCEVAYLSRTEGISSTQLKDTLSIDKETLVENINDIASLLDRIKSTLDY